MSFVIYLIGTAIFIAGVAWALASMNVSSQWIVIVCLIMLGIGIFTGVSKTRAKDPS